MIAIKVVHPVVVFVVFCSIITFVNCYSKVFRAGANTNVGLEFSDGPTIHRALNTDIVFPKVFNTSAASADSEEISDKTAGFTGRASNYHRPLQLSLFNPPRLSSGPVQPDFENKPSPGDFYPIYRPRPPNKPELDKLTGKGEAQDRYTPGEAVASSLYKQNGNKKGYVYSFPQQPAPDTIISQKDLFAFPPNLGSNYGPSPKPSETKIESSISSYLPPPAGPVNPFSGFVGPVSPEYLPNHLKNPPIDDIGSKMNSKPTSSMDDGSNTAVKDEGDHGDTPPTPPPEFMHAHNHDSLSSDQVMELMAEQMPMNDPPPDDHSYEDHANDQQDHGPHPEYGQHGPWDTLPNYFSGHSLDSFPDIIYDDPHHHHHHIPAPPPLVTTTTTERPEPRVKKYSYFYLSRKLWYIPLYFTVWFSFYILFLILKSIARHKVNLPNHYQRSIMKRSLVEDIGHKPTTEEINRLTEYAMSKIDAFKQMYL